MGNGLQSDLNASQEEVAEEDESINPVQAAKNDENLKRISKLNDDQCELELEKNPFDNYARFRLAQILIQQGAKIDMAKKLIDSIRQSEKKFLKAECFELQGDIENLDSIKNYEEAIMYYIKSQKKNPENLMIYIKLGKTHEKMREFDEAVTYINKALRRDPKSFIANYRMGICMIRNNQKAEGI